ncbi:PE family protein, partial [Mycobacterium basiliense]
MSFTLPCFESTHTLLVIWSVEMSSFVVVSPEVLVSASGSLAGIGSAISEANAAAAR